MRVRLTAITGIMVLACCIHCGDDGENDDAGTGVGQTGGAASTVPTDIFWNCPCTYKCGLTLSLSMSRSACRSTEAEAQQAAEESCNTMRNSAETCELCTCQCSTTNAACNPKNGAIVGSGAGSGAARGPAPTASLYCCALGKLCSKSAVGDNPCLIDTTISSALATGSEQECQAALDSAVLDVQVADCAVDPNCLYTEANAMAECQ